MIDSVRTRIRKALIYQFEKIRTENGFRSSVGEIHDEGVSIEQIHNFPALVITFGTEETLNFQTQNQTWAKLQKELPVYVDCFLHDKNNISLSRDKILQDIEKIIGNYISLPGPDGVCTCSQAEVVRSIPWGLRSNKPNGGISVQIRVRYNQLRTDPTEKC